MLHEHFPDIFMLAAYFTLYNIFLLTIVMSQIYKHCKANCNFSFTLSSFFCVCCFAAQQSLSFHSKFLSAPVLSQRPLTATTLREAASAAVPVLRQGPRGVSGPIHGCSGPCGVSRRICMGKEWEKGHGKVVNPNTFLLIKHSSLSYILVHLYRVLAL